MCVKIENINLNWKHKLVASPQSIVGPEFNCSTANIETLRCIRCFHILKSVSLVEVDNAVELFMFTLVEHETECYFTAVMEDLFYF